MNLEIKRNGSWHYMNTPIRRTDMIQLFAQYLKLEAGNYYLITPFEKVRVKVEDVPFLITQVVFHVAGDMKDQKIEFITNLGESVMLDQNHPLSVSEQLYCAPYMEVRDGLKARINRNVYYELAEKAQCSRNDRGEMKWGIWSCGFFYVLGQTEDCI